VSSRELPGRAGREEIIVARGAHRHAGEPALQRVRRLERSQARNSQPVPRDFDLLTLFNVVEQRQQLALTSVTLICLLI
jgi:hypothetical protein